MSLKPIGKGLGVGGIRLKRIQNIVPEKQDSNKVHITKTESETNLEEALECSSEMNKVKYKKGKYRKGKYCSKRKKGKGKCTKKPSNKKSKKKSKRRHKKSNKMKDIFSMYDY